MGNYKVRGVWQKVETYEAAIDEAVKTFTLPAGDNYNKTSMYVLVMDGSVDGAATIYMAFNGVGANYFTEGVSTIGGTSTVIDVGTAATGLLYSSTIMAGADDNFHGIVEILLVKGSSADYIHSILRANANGHQINSSIRSVNDATELTSIEITTSANKWQAGTRFTLYKVNR